MVNPKLEYIEDLVMSVFSERAQKRFSFTLTENNLIIIKYKIDSITTSPSLWKQTLERTIVEKLFTYGLRVHEDYKIETDIKYENHYLKRVY
jgi:hypothetical protein